MSFAKVIVLFCLAVSSASALATPRAAHNPLHHRDLAARLAAAEPAPVPVVLEAREVKPLRKRSSNRCVKKSSTSSSAAPSSTSAPINVAPAPPKTSSTPPKTSSTPPPPKTSSKPAPPPPPPTTVQHTPSPTTHAPPPSPTSNEPVYLQGTNTGDGTFYAIGLGACGIVNSGNDMIVALSEHLFDTYPGYNGENPNDNPVCNRGITAHYQGKTVHVTATDRCTGCALEDLDFSPAAFSQLADFSVGRIHGMTWTFD